MYRSAVYTSFHQELFNKFNIYNDSTYGIAPTAIGADLAIISTRTMRQGAENRVAEGFNQIQGMGDVDHLPSRHFSASPVQSAPMMTATATF